MRRFAAAALAATSFAYVGPAPPTTPTLEAGRYTATDLRRP